MRMSKQKKTAVRRCNTIIYCRRWRATVTFYRDIIGFPSAFSNDWFVELTVAPRSFLSIADEARATIRSSQGDGITLSFEVADVSRMRRRVIRKGIIAERVRTHPWGARCFFIHDPEGNRIEFWSKVH